MDGRVIDAPWPIRFGIVHFSILPKRPRTSAEAYRAIWTAEGSPLIAISRRLQAALEAKVEIPVELAMRYQNPSIDAAIKRLANWGIGELLLIPLFPHYAMSSYETAVERVNARLKVFWGVDDGNLTGSRRFFAQVGVVLAVHAVFATLLAAAPRREGTLGKIGLSPIGEALRAAAGAEAVAV